MDKLNTPNEILKLGKKIIKELAPEDDDSLTLLEKWMAHHIAELIHKSEHEKNIREKEKLQKECSGIILDLWKLRSGMSSPCMPMQKIQKAIDLLYELKKDKTIWEQLHSKKNVSWNSLAETFYDNYMRAIKLCIHASMDENALEWEKIWVEEFENFLSSEEKDMVEALEDFMQKQSPVLNFIAEHRTSKNNPTAKEKTTESILEQLEKITEEQQKVIHELKSNLKTSN